MIVWDCLQKSFIVPSIHVSSKIDIYLLSIGRLSIETVASLFLTKTAPKLYAP
jgi:hypothetical protein